MVTVTGSVTIQSEDGIQTIPGEEFYLQEESETAPIYMYMYADDNFDLIFEIDCYNNQPRFTVPVHVSQGKASILEDNLILQ